MFPLVQEMAAKDAPIRVPVVVACRVLGFSRQAYYQWVKQPVSKREADDQHLIQVLRQLHAEDPEFGYRFLTDEMQDLGYVITERRVWRLCKQAGIRSVITKRKSSAGRAGAPVGDDLVEREFTAAGPNRLWLTDITEQWTRRIPVVVATVDTYAGSSKAAIRSAGVSQPNDFRGRPFNSSAITASCSDVNWRRSAPLGRY